MKHSSREEGKQPINLPKRSRTRPANKLRLNEKALFDTYLKKFKLNIIDDEAPENIPTITRKEKMEIKTLKDMPMKKIRKIKRQKVTFVVEIP